ncbi:glucokinase, putative [Talaromyces stipitatus ATCC 10500]|uniref:Phosphotransferase n=1 Tax=Talaromyces stipitatus (strain ATCC 10500 / CBS 375.48 / QM 6759 / NRRL 1006) TaxID=441959 RepID=B8M0S4_TALSN|nr:glucokinase, putative [Talaromyces stipitatus ATCC 10500]EED21457.1 glucokinase, putative [Talaromyces stipitatus ATCC 10500]
MSPVTDDQQSGLLARAERVAEEFALGREDVRRITSHFVRQMRDGLTHNRAWQLPSFVRSVPTGAEKGTFLAVDLGGSNCRICLVHLRGDSTFTTTQTRHRVPPEVMVCQSYKPLFDFIAAKTAEFLAENLASNTKGYDRAHGRATPYRLGFTFSFTCEQTSLAGGTLIRWDKGWDIPEAVGKDPCVMLQEAIDKLGLPVLVTVLANDSVGTLLTRSYTAGWKISTLAAIIFGTGTNAAYVEKLSNIKRLGVKKGSAGEIMVINTEWGCLDDKMEVLPRTCYDDELDRESTDPGIQTFEKRVSGMYLGELLRLVLVRLVQEDSFEMSIDKESPLFQSQGIDSSFLSDLAIAGDKDSSKALSLVESKLSAKNVTVNDVKTIQILSAAIVRRAARLAGASLAAIIIQSGRLEPPLTKLKYSGTKVTEQEAVESTNTRMSSIQRFRHNLNLLWRRIVKFLARLNISQEQLQSAGSIQQPDTEKSIIDIGADGSVFELYPTFEADMRGALIEVPEIGPSGEKRVRIGLAKDGSGVGAALMAQAALEMEKKAQH